MKSIRRLYFYLVAFISIEVVLWGLVGLLRSVANDTISGGADALAQALALILVGVPIFLIHWLWVQRASRLDEEEKTATLRAVFFYLPEHKFVITSGYRCSVSNEQHGRSSTNHHGKAVDFNIVPRRGEDQREDMTKCEAVRGRIVETACGQIGWNAPNCKALEPSSIAPTWVHYDVRCYEPRYLQDRMFCRTRKQLDGRRPIRF